MVLSDMRTGIYTPDGTARWHPASLPQTRLVANGLDGLQVLSSCTLYELLKVSTEHNQTHKARYALSSGDALLSRASIS